MIPLAEIIEAAGVDLRPAGPGRLRGLCPLHQEKTPSFFVFEDRQRWRCFGCGEGGDAIDFVRRMHGFTYRQALSFLGADDTKRTAGELRRLRIERQKRQALEWREREVAWTLGTAIRRCHDLLAQITPGSLDDFALVLTHLSHLEYQHDILINGDPAARAAVVSDYRSTKLFPRRLLFQPGFDYRGWLRSVSMEPRNERRFGRTGGDSTGAVTKAA